MNRSNLRVEDMNDIELHDCLSNYGFEFVDTSADAMRLQKAPLMVLSTKGSNKPLIRIFTFEFRWENPKYVDSVQLMRKQHLTDRESLWVDLSFNMYKNIFEVTPSAVKMSPRGIPIPAYRAVTLFNRGIPVELQVSDEIIESREAYDALEDYKQKEFDIGIIGPLMAERIRRFLNDNDFVIDDSQIKDRAYNDHLRHELTAEQSLWIVEQINQFISGHRDLKGSIDTVPTGETNEEIDLQIDSSRANVLSDRDQTQQEINH